MNLEDEEEGLKDIKQHSDVILYKFDKIHPRSMFY